MELLKTYIYTGKFKDRTGLLQNANRYLIDFAIKIPQGFYGKVIKASNNGNNSFEIKVRIIELHRLFESIVGGDELITKLMRGDSIQNFSWRKEEVLVDDTEIQIDVLMDHLTFLKLPSKIKEHIKTRNIIEGVVDALDQMELAIEKDQEITQLKILIKNAIEKIEQAEEIGLIDITEQNNAQTKKAVNNALDIIKSKIEIRERQLSSNGTGVKIKAIEERALNLKGGKFYRGNLVYTVSKMSKKVRGKGSDIIE